MIHKSVYSFQSQFVQRSKEKVLKVLLFFKLLMLDYNCRKGFLRLSIIVKQTSKHFQGHLVF